MNDDAKRWLAYAYVDLRAAKVLTDEKNSGSIGSQGFGPSVWQRLRCAAGKRLIGGHPPSGKA